MNTKKKLSFQTMEDSYWQIWVKRDPKKWIVYNSEIPVCFMNLSDATTIKLIKLQKRNYTFFEIDYTRYLKVFQRAWHRLRRIRKKALKYLRLRELGLAPPNILD